MTAPLRRVITGLDAEGRSCILIDGPSEKVLWSTTESPADNSRTEDAGGGPFGFDIPVGGTRLIFHDFPPGGGTMMHATNTLDYIVIVSGEVTFITETGETHLRQGDVLVDRGIVHAWRNDGTTPCRIVNVLVLAHPVGKGATV